TAPSRRRTPSYPTGSALLLEVRARADGEVRRRRARELLPLARTAPAGELPAGRGDRTQGQRAPRGENLPAGRRARHRALPGGRHLQRDRERAEERGRRDGRRELQQAARRRASAAPRPADETRRRGPLRLEN